MNLHVVTAAPVALTNPAPFVRPDLSYDIAAIKEHAKFRYALRLPFINGYEGKPRRTWQRSIARRVIGQARLLAGEQRHKIVWAQMPSPLPYTAEELERRDILRLQMACAPVTATGNADYRKAASEYGAIGSAASRRAYDAILARGGL